MTYHLKALVSTVILLPILEGLQWKIFALDFLYIIEWTVSYTGRFIDILAPWARGNLLGELQNHSFSGSRDMKLTEVIFVPFLIPGYKVKKS